MVMMKTVTMSRPLVGRYVELQTQALRNRPASYWGRVLITHESQTGLQVEWKAWGFVKNERTLLTHRESVPWPLIVGLKPYIAE